MRYLNYYYKYKELFYSRVDKLFIALRESFIMMVPYLLLLSSLIMIVQFFGFLEVDKTQFYYELTLQVTIYIQKLFPILLLISISYNLANILDINKLLSIFSALVIYISLVTIDNFIMNKPFVLNPMPTFSTIFTPLFSTYVLSFYNNRFIGNDNDRILHSQLHVAFRYFLPFVVAFVSTLVIILVLEQVFYMPVDWLKNYLNSLSDYSFMILRTIYAHTSWFFGIHGSVSTNLLFEPNNVNNMLEFGLSNKEFYDLFVIYGGSGAGLSLALAILIYGKNKNWNRVSKLSLPFVTFNINEILIYGLPVVLNRYLLVPFLLVPILNFIIAYYFLSAGFITFLDVNIHWTTPIFINSYIYTDGDLYALLLQFSLVSLGIIIYIPFIHRYTLSQSYEGKIKTLKKKLDIYDSLKSTSNLQFNNSQYKVIKKNIEIDKTIEMIANNELLLYYQPKVDLKDHQYNSCEALIRLKMDDKIVGPYFIEDLEDYGMSYIIDIWVCTQVKKDLEQMKIEFITLPRVSINISPDTLSNENLVDKIIFLLKGYDIELEILERGFLDYEKTNDNIVKLLDNNIDIVVDDFGVGYSGLSMLYNCKARALKIDKSLVDLLSTQKGKLIFNSIVKLGKDLDFEIIAEGVETQEQYIYLKESQNIDKIQGFYFSKPVPLDDLYKSTRSIQTLI